MVPVQDITLLDLVSLQVRIGFRKFCQLGFIVHAWFRHFEATGTIPHVSFDINDSVDSFQIAPDRGGTIPSKHVGNTEAHENNLK